MEREDLGVEIRVEFRSAAGRSCQDEPAGLRGVPVEARAPLSQPRAYRGRRSKITKWTSASSGWAVWCSSDIQKSAAMLLDFDPDIACFQSNVVQVHWEKNGKHGTTEPAFMARTRQGQRLAIVHPPRSTAGLEEEALQQTAEEAGWRIRPLTVPQGVLRSSLRTVAHFRHTRIPSEQDRHRVLAAFATPLPLTAGAARCGLGPPSMDYAWHLLWTGELSCDWGRPLLPTSRVWASGRDTSKESEG
ncbi:hypothetical protein ACFV3R_33130 [Streptomyces sp. NPDC059740]|uniref:hypothetical protein n=1 Tax=Streptomyces sp. NPDC059740 TaxID=3346926 RepID=UPI003647FA5A